LGEGGSGIVFLANQELFGRNTIKRVIKFFLFRQDIVDLRNIDGSTPVSIENFTTEISALSDLNHKNLVRIVDADIYERNGHKIPYIVYDFIEGDTLRGFDPKTLSPEKRTSDQIIYNIIEMCNGVNFLHSQGYFHYDIAPKNIFCNSALNNEFVVGDLGLARRPSATDSSVFVVGSKDWVPPDIVSLINRSISATEFRALQPRWDVYGLAKTIDYFLLRLDPKDLVGWAGTIRAELQRVIEKPGDYSVGDLIHRIRFASPQARQTTGVPELSPGMSEKQIQLMPVHPLVTTRRIQELIDHPAIVRLHKIPQLTAAYLHFPSANHTRFEHSLGVMEVMRRFLMTIISDKNFVIHLSESQIELALLAALLSNSHQFCFTNVLNDMRMPEKWKIYLSKEAIIRKAMGQTYGSDRTLSDLIHELFPTTNIDRLINILTSQVDTDSDKLIFSMLNSSIDARVVDYIARDSHHLGVIGSTNGEISDIFQFVDVYKNRIALNARGISAAEQIIAQRYWLFNRFYWNRPNRRYISTLRIALAGLGEQLNFIACLFDDCAEMNAEESLIYLQKAMRESGTSWLVDLARFVKQENGVEYKIRYDHNLTDRAYLSEIYRKLDEMDLGQRTALDRRLAREVFESGEDIYGVIVDLPRENGALKFGDDIIVMFDRDGENTRTLAGASPIVRGIKESYDSQLRRLRIFVHPEIERRYSSRDVVIERIEGYMSSLIL
jgi:HD superfamily phosphohydrolase